MNNTNTSMQMRPFLLSAVDSLPETMDILPSQYHGQVQESQGERALMLAVLEDAIACYQRGSEGDLDGEPTMVAEDYISSEDTSWPYSFLNVCEALDINVQRLREALRSWKEQGVQNAVGRKVHSKRRLKAMGSRAQA